MSENIINNQNMDQTTPSDSTNTPPLETLPVNSEGENSIEESMPVSEIIKDTLVIKGKLKLQTAGIYGIFAIILRSDIGLQFEPDLNPLISLHLLASYFSDICHINLKEKWNTLEKKFNTMHIQGAFATSITDNLRQHINTSLFGDAERSITLIQDFKTNNTTAIHKELDLIFSEMYKDRQLDLELAYEELNSSENATIKALRIKEEKPQPNTNILETPSIVVNPLDFSVPANPILAPVEDGIAAYQLSQGVRILMKIDRSSPYSKQWIDTFNLYDTQSDSILPLIGTVNQIGPIIRNSVDVLVKYQDHQYTKFNIESNVKVKIFFPSRKERIVDPLVQNGYQQNQSVALLNFKDLMKDKEFRNMLILGVLLTILAVIGLYNL